jgi:MFS-type transporter involved in bile tolerance (Atg22 family)
MGLNNMFASIGSVLCMWVCPYIAEEYGLIEAVLSGVVINIFSTVCSLIASYMDKRFESSL